MWFMRPEANVNPIAEFSPTSRLQTYDRERKKFRGTAAPHLQFHLWNSNELGNCRRIPSWSSTNTIYGIPQWNFHMWIYGISVWSAQQAYIRTYVPWKVRGNVCMRGVALGRTHCSRCHSSPCLTYIHVAQRPCLSMYSGERIKVLLQGGASISEIVNRLKSKGIITCRQTVWRF